MIEDWVTTTEAARIAGVSPKRILQLTGSVLDSQKIGRDRFIQRASVEAWARGRGYRARWRPLDLRELRFKRGEILSLAERHHLTNVRVFGSIATGTATENSDVDFVVDMTPKATVMDVAAMAADLEDSLGCHVDVITTRRSVPFLDQILATAIPL